MKEISLQYDVEQPKSDSTQSPRLQTLKFIALILVVLLVVALLPVVIVVASKGKTIDESLWRDVSPDVSHLNITHTYITGVWSNLLFIAGTDITNNGVIELYKYNKKNNNDARWTKQSQLVTGPDFIAATVAISLHGNRIAICTVRPLQFIVYENINDNNEWKQYGETFYASDVFVNDNATTTAAFDEASLTDTPEILLSDDGRVLTVTFPTASGEGSVHVLTDVNSLGGTIGGVWKHRGRSIQSGHSMDSSFARHAAMDGSGQKVVVSGDGIMSMYEWSDKNGNKSTWELTAEYDESPVPEYGSLALSKDGTTIAIGSYKSRDTVDGSGELYILNDVWPWFNYNDENPWFIENGQDGPDYDHQSAGKIQVSLSSKGDFVLVERQRKSSNGDQTKFSLQVYHFDATNTEWVSLGLPFGSQEHQSTTNPYPTQHIDISDDGTIVATAILGKVFVYLYE